jgi:hypothetical protein
LSNGENDAGWAFGIVSMFLIANIYSLLDLVMIITASKLPQVSNLTIIAIGGVVLYLNHVLLLKNGKAKVIAKEFDEKQGSRAILNLILFLYVSTWFLCVYIVFILLFLKCLYMFYIVFLISFYMIAICLLYGVYMCSYGVYMFSGGFILF